jgi:hypothetical protein
MLDKIKDIGSQVATQANAAVEGITTTVKGGVESLANSAGAMTVTLNEKAVRASTAQMCSILELALEEMKGRPIAERRVSLTATVNIGIAALEMQIHLDPQAEGSATAPASMPVPIVSKP